MFILLVLRRFAPPPPPPPPPPLLVIICVVALLRSTTAHVAYVAPSSSRASVSAPAFLSVVHPSRRGGCHALSTNSASVGSWNERLQRRGVRATVRVRCEGEKEGSHDERDVSKMERGGCNRGEATMSRRKALLAAAASAASASSSVAVASALGDDVDADLLQRRRSYVQQFPTLFDPLYGPSSRITIKRTLVPNQMWSIEQSLKLGPLETPLRCVVVKLADGRLWVHNPVAPTDEFFDLVESCARGTDDDDDGRGDTVGGGDRAAVVSHVVISTYALEHKVFAKDALNRWTSARLWIGPNQFSFPIQHPPDEWVWGRVVDGILDGDRTPPWIDEIEYETLTAGTFDLAGGPPIRFCETTFYHKPSRSLLVTDAVAWIPPLPPSEEGLNDPSNLLLVSKRSTSDPMPSDTEEARRIGWEKTNLLVSYFFPEHEEPDPNKLGVITWTDGWHENFQQISNRLLVPPVVRTVIYAQNPMEVKRWVDRVVQRWDFVRIIPAHWDAPIEAGPIQFKRAFAFLDDPGVDAFPEEDVRRGLKPLAEFATKKKGRSVGQGRPVCGVRGVEVLFPEIFLQDSGSK